MRSKALRYLISIAADIFLVFVAFFVSLMLRFEGVIPPDFQTSFLTLILPIAGVYAISNYAFGLYQRLWRYASSEEAISILGSVTLSTLLLGLADLVIGKPRLLPISVILMGGVLTLAAFASIRYRQRLITGFLWRWRRIRSGYKHRVLVIGAGEAGQLVTWSLNNQREGYEVVGLIDDDPRKVGLSVHGARVLGDRKQIVPTTSRRMADMIVIALDSASGEDFQDILSNCQKTSAKIKVVPNLFEMMESKEGQPPIRDITVEDLLGRKSVPIDVEACRDLLQDKVILVTGGAGSIGSELCRQILRFQPRLLLIMDNNETGLHDLNTEVSLNGLSHLVRICVGDIARESRLEALFQSHKPNIVFHCAAYKHVPILEEYPEEAVWTNVLGTESLARLAMKYEVERFVFISTDKAVEPQSVMGATKRIGELMMFCLSTQGRTKFTSVRFGNVLNSRGSVVPTFLKQIDQGGPVTVTHPEMSRFFMGMLEAVSLIIQAAALTKGGDTFMLEMGEEMNIVELARKIIRLRGLRVGEDIKVIYTGIRPGERLKEELLCAPFENKRQTDHPFISRVESSYSLPVALLEAKIKEIGALAQNGHREQLLSAIWELASFPTHAAQEPLSERTSRS